MLCVRPSNFSIQSLIGSLVSLILFSFLSYIKSFASLLKLLPHILTGLVWLATFFLFFLFFYHFFTLSLKWLIKKRIVRLIFLPMLKSNAYRSSHDINTLTAKFMCACVSGWECKHVNLWCTQIYTMHMCASKYRPCFWLLLWCVCTSPKVWIFTGVSVIDIGVLAGYGGSLFKHRRDVVVSTQRQWLE